jgi:hypothetical protein
MGNRRDFVDRPAHRRKARGARVREAGHGESAGGSRAHLQLVARAGDILPPVKLAGLRSCPRQVQITESGMTRRY